ncbi:hypothetical protein T07_6673 [Trichinella nelsoni]|uniref:Uncharacterized protein n=1 Tax=Trichinella nelsoni TaxID=6336 RepID=A0A0V0RY04_9BILA|nr:hypothetical protein T07_6673 [Trichinella nelsoni]
MTEKRLYGLKVIRRSFWKNNCKIGKPCKGSVFVAVTGKLYLLMRLTISLDWGGNSSISNLRKPVFNATCVVSVFYANWAI